MKKATFKVFSASAGSGKTYALVQSYLEVLLSASHPAICKKILAVTFTNKAVEEMKSRILTTLGEFSNPDIICHPNDMFVDLCKSTKLPAQKLHERAKNGLQYIAHHYHDFNVSTIDRFTQKVVRTFAQDLKLSHNFEVSLDHSKVLSEAVDRFISKAGGDSQLTEIMLDFVFDKVQDDKSADISIDFFKMSERLLSENDLPILEQISTLEIKDHMAFKKLLKNTIHDLHEQVKSVAQSVLESLEEQEIALTSFPYQTLPNHFKKIAGGEIKNLYANKLEEQIEVGQLLSKKASEDERLRLDHLLPEIQKAYQHQKVSIHLLGLYQNFLSNITPLSVLKGLDKELEQMKLEQNFLLISEFNNLISNHLKNEPTAFIYERLGENYSHFFIDEFQDTSVKQWENLLPLLSHSLASTGSSVTLVGDAKQAIYRWRGGKVEQFIRLSERSPFHIKLDRIVLPKNYRSDFHIVDFNNKLFQCLSKFVFSDPSHAQLFEQSKQDHKKTGGGYVSLTFIDTIAESKYADYCAAVFDRIVQCNKDGIDLGDIVVLVRKNKEGIAVARHLAKNNIAVVSSESLILSSSPEVRLVVKILKMILEPKNLNVRLEVLTYLGQNREDIDDWHAFYVKHLFLKEWDFFKSLSTLGVDFNPKDYSGMSIYEMVEGVIIAFGLAHRSDAYLQYFLDEVLQFMSQKSAGLSAFLEYYEQNESKLSIVGTKQSNAVQIMTIHSAKGLEFPVVIFPFAEQNIYKEPSTKLWYNLDNTPFSHMAYSLVNVNKDLPHTGTQGTDIYNKHRSDLELDNLNLLYVALTRAENQLHVIGNQGHQPHERTYSGFLKYFLEKQGVWNSQKQFYQFGDLYDGKKMDSNTNESIEKISCSMRPISSLPARIITNASLMWNEKFGDALERGNLMHWYMAQIKQETDIPFASELLLRNGMASESQKEDLETIARNIVSNPMVKPFFSGAHKTYNERDILDPEGNISRPDRINIISKNEAVIIDYKSSQPDSIDQKQLNGYRFALHQMGYEFVKNILIYVSEDTTPEFVVF